MTTRGIPHPMRPVAKGTLPSRIPAEVTVAPHHPGGAGQDTRERGATIATRASRGRRRPVEMTSRLTAVEVPLRDMIGGEKEEEGVGVALAMAEEEVATVIVVVVEVLEVVVVVVMVGGTMEGGEGEEVVDIPQDPSLAVQV